MQRRFERWGLKDVRLTIEDAHFIRWLFPNAKFVFLCRNPYDAYKSYRLDRSWYFEWPNKPVFTAAEFGHHWNRLVSGFYKGAPDLGGLFVRYEDILSGTVNCSAIETYLELKIDKSLLENKVGSHRNFGEPLSSNELKQLRNEVDPMAKILEYEYILQ